MAIFHSVLVWCHSVLFSLGCCRLHSFDSFLSMGLFFGLCVFRGSVLSNLQGCFDILNSFSELFCSILSNLQGYFDILSSFFGFILRLSLFSDSVDFSFSKCSYFLNLSRLFLGGGFFYRAFLLSGSVLSSTPHTGLLCLLRMHTINSCVGDTWQRLWWDDFTHNGKEVVNRLKIPQGLSTLMFHRWSEVPSRGGVHGDSP